MPAEGGSRNRPFEHTPDLKTRQWTYDGNGNVASQQDPAGHLIGYAHGVLDRVKHEICSAVSELPALQSVDKPTTAMGRWPR